MTLEQLLADARIQYHALVTGQAAKVFVDQNGERVEYVAANAGRLLLYIQGLERQLEGKTISGPMRILM